MTTTEIGALAFVVLLLVSVIMRLADLVREETSLLDVIGTWAQTHGLKILQIERVPFGLESLSLCPSGNQVAFRAVVKDASGTCRKCYFLYGSWLIGPIVPRVTVRWMSGSLAKAASTTDLDNEELLP